MIFTLEHHNWLLRRAAQAAPFEVCGFIMCDGSIIEIRNVAENPYHTFKPDLEAIRLCEWGYLIATADEVAVYEAQENGFWDAFVQDESLNFQEVSFNG